MPALKVKKGEGLAASFSLLDDVTVLGRSVDCDIVLQHMSVSRQHAKVSSTDNVYSIEDLQSRNGVFVNGNPLDEPRLLANGDVIQICGYLFSFVLRPSHELADEAVGV